MTGRTKVIRTRAIRIFRRMCPTLFARQSTSATARRDKKFWLGSALRNSQRWSLKLTLVMTIRENLKIKRISRRSEKIRGKRSEIFQCLLQLLMGVLMLWPCPLKPLVSAMTSLKAGALARNAGSSTSKFLKSEAGVQEVGNRREEGQTVGDRFQSTG